ncbi:hypothetical protein ES705_17342 [subsurface metagenome]
MDCSRYSQRQPGFFVGSLPGFNLCQHFFLKVFQPPDVITVIAPGYFPGNIASGSFHIKGRVFSYAAKN